MKKEEKVRERSRFDRFIDGVERVGNKLPSPFWLFILLIAVVFAASAILSAMGVSVTYLKASKDAAEVPTETTAAVQNLLSRENLRYLFQNFTTIYSSFAPLGLVIIMMLGVGFMEKVGMLNALIRKTILGAPESLMIAVIALVGVNANLASDAGVVIVPALAGALFKAMGKNPWIGIIAGYAAANGGFSANLFVAGTDVLLAGITESVCSAAGIEAPTHPLINWYFMIAATFLITAATVVVTKFFMEKRLGNQNISSEAVNLDAQRLTDGEKRGLRYGGLAALLYILVLLALLLPEGALLRADNGDIVPQSPFLSSIVFLLFLFFFLISVVYGKASGAIKNMGEVPVMMQKGVSDILSFVVIAVPASIFITLFDLSNIATVVGVSLGELLKSVNLTGFPLMLMFILICTVMNLVMTSSSIKWLILAPVFIPVMANLGYSPALTQITYRIADTCTNIISPIDYYVPVIMGLLATYNLEKDKKIGIGTVISLCLPYSIAFLCVMIPLLAVWMAFALPLGPGVSIFY